MLRAKNRFLTKCGHFLIKEIILKQQSNENKTCLKN